MTFHANLELADVIGAVPGGWRTITNVTGGTFEGARLRGKILPGGGDWVFNTSTSNAQHRTFNSESFRSRRSTRHGCSRIQHHAKPPRRILLPCDCPLQRLMSVVNRDARTSQILRDHHSDVCRAGGSASSTAFPRLLSGACGHFWHRTHRIDRGIVADPPTPLGRGVGRTASRRIETRLGTVAARAASVPDRTAEIRDSHETSH